MPQAEPYELYAICDFCGWQWWVSPGAARYLDASGLRVEHPPHCPVLGPPLLAYGLFGPATEEELANTSVERTT